MTSRIILPCIKGFRSINSIDRSWLKSNSLKCFQVLQGIDLALTLMYKGESCILRLAPRFAYGEVGLKAGERLGLISDPEKQYNGPVIDPETWLEATLELHDWCEEPELETLTIADRMEIGYIFRFVFENRFA